MVRELAQTTHGWTLVVGPTISPRQVQVDAVVLATPAVASARLLRDVVTSAARELGRIDYASVALVTLAVDASLVDPGITGSGFLVPPVDGRTIKASTYSSNKWRWLAGDVAIFRGSIGRFGDEDELQRPDTELVEAVAMDLREAIGLRAPLLDATVTRWGGALPQYVVGHLDRVERIRRSVAGVARLEVCGAAFEGVGIPAVIADAEAAATRMLADLADTGE
jgi:oxygen-dependent protoporphyrinogen oxidase